VITYQQLGERLSIVSHQSVFDPRSGKVLAHLEFARNLDADYFAQFAREMDLDLTFAFHSEYDSVAGRLDNKADLAALHISEVGEHYVAVMQKDIIGGKVYFTTMLDRAIHTAVLNTHRTRFLLLMLAVGTLALLGMRVVIWRRLSQPLRLLMKQIQKVEQGDYSPSEPVGTGDELETISISVNELSNAVHERELSLELARSEQEYLSQHDALTGLPNRRFLHNGWSMRWIWRGAIAPNWLSSLWTWTSSSWSTTR